MKIIFIGGVKVSYEILERILEENWDVKLIFSYENDKKKNFSDFKDLTELADKYNIPNVQVKNINDTTNIEMIKKIKPDLILVMGWSQILKKEIIEIPKLGVVGSHPTELPKYRGRAPIPWTILKNLKTTALTFFYINEGIDTGDIVLQKKLCVEDNENATSLYSKICKLGKEMISEFLIKLEKNEIKIIKQSENDFIEYWEKRQFEHGKINWKLSSIEIDRLIRATTHPYPGAYTIFKKRIIKIWKSEISHLRVLPETIKIIDDDVYIGTNDGSIKLISISFDNDIPVRPKKIFGIKDNNNKLDEFS